MTTHAKSCSHWNASVEGDSSTAVQPWASLWPGTVYHPLGPKSDGKEDPTQCYTVHCQVWDESATRIKELTGETNLKAGGDSISVSPRHQAWRSGEEHYPLTVSQGKLKRCVLKWGLDK